MCGKIFKAFGNFRFPIQFLQLLIGTSMMKSTYCFPK